MLKNKELYEGFSNEQAKIYRNEAVQKWGKETIEKSEQQLKKLSKAELDILKNEFKEVGRQLSESVNETPNSSKVQVLIKKHYQCIHQFWGKKPSKEAYIGLGGLYVNDERYTMQNSVSNQEFAERNLE